MFNLLEIFSNLSFIIFYRFSGTKIGNRSKMMKDNDNENSPTSVKATENNDIDKITEISKSASQISKEKQESRLMTQ